MHANPKFRTSCSDKIVDETTCIFLRYALLFNLIHQKNTTDKIQQERVEVNFNKIERHKFEELWIKLMS